MYYFWNSSVIIVCEISGNRKGWKKWTWDDQPEDNGGGPDRLRDFGKAACWLCPSLWPMRQAGNQVGDEVETKRTGKALCKHVWHKVIALSKLSAEIIAGKDKGCGQTFLLGRWETEVGNFMFTLIGSLLCSIHHLSIHLSTHPLICTYWKKSQCIWGMCAHHPREWPVTWHICSEGRR